MIEYFEDSERWEDSEDNEFSVSMTPEGHREWGGLVFRTQEEFWAWYNSSLEDSILI